MGRLQNIVYTNVGVLVFGAIVGANRQIDEEISYGWRFAAVITIAWAMMLVSGAAKGNRECQIGMYDILFFSVFYLMNQFCKLMHI